MRIADLLRDETIQIGGAPTTKDEAIDKLVDLMVRGGNVADRDAYAAAVREREAQFSTCLGDRGDHQFRAVPHRALGGCGRGLPRALPAQEASASRAERAYQVSAGSEK